MKSATTAVVAALVLPMLVASCRVQTTSSDRPPAPASTKTAKSATRRGGVIARRNKVGGSIW